MNNLVKHLFETNALKVCENNKPFWYTSGKIGPYFINTHFLYGSENDAVKFLSFIDEEKGNKLELPEKVFKATLAQYQNNAIYKEVIDCLLENIKSNIDVNEIDYVSGGERRDWFFSNIVAYLLGKPHITVFKDLDVVISSSDFSTTKDIKDLKTSNNNENSEKIESSKNSKILENKKVLHVADLITAASSYFRAWIPAIENLGAKICWSAVVVDRLQGGSKKLEDANVKSYSLIQISPELFSAALDAEIITEEQRYMLESFYQDPDGTMRRFLLEHPDFLENALNSDEKTAGRARLCIDNDLYGLNN